MTRFAFLFLFLASVAQAADPAVSVVNVAGRNTITIEYDADSVEAPPPPLLPVAEWSGTANPVLLALPVPGDLDTEHGSVPLLDPSSGVIALVGVGMARRSVLSGQAPPTLVDGVRSKIRDKLRDEYAATVSDWMYVQRAGSTPAAVVQGLVADLSP